MTNDKQVEQLRTLALLTVPSDHVLIDYDGESIVLTTVFGHDVTPGDVLLNVARALLRAHDEAEGEDAPRLRRVT